MADRRRVLLVGGGDLAEEVCEALDAAEAEVKWLEHADDEALRDAVGAKPDVVCVATRDDAFPLRIALLVRHLDEDVPLLVTIFDPGSRSRSPTRSRTATSPRSPTSSRRRSRARASHRTCSPCCATASAPSAWMSSSRRSSCRRARRTGCAASTTALFHPYDRSAALLFYGFAGLVIDALLRAVRGDDRARAVVPGRVLRLHQVAGHGRAEHRHRRRAEVVQGRNRGAR